MKLHDILDAKGGDVFTVLAGNTLLEAVQALVRHNCGSLVVVAEDSAEPIAGIITERDIMKFCAAGDPLVSAQVEACMTREVVTGSAEDTISATMALMTERRIRHLPIVDGGQLVGMISIGDVVKAQGDSLSAENHHLKNYIHG